MSAATGHGLPTRGLKQRPPGAPGARSPSPQSEEPQITTFSIYQFGKKSLYQMPIEIIASIFVEWSMLEWFAPTVARQLCRDFKAIADSTPRVWSKLFLHGDSGATGDDVRKWLERAKTVPKEILLASEDVPVISAALESAKDATSLIYRIPPLTDIPPHEEELIQLPIHLSQLRHLHLDTSSVYDFVGRINIFGLYNSSNNANFPCLTILRLTFVDLTGFRMMPGLFPVMRRLVLHQICGPILDLIQVCSRSLEDLRVTSYFSHDQRSSPHGRIRLPNLKVLIVQNAVGIVSNLESPTLRLLHADLDEMNASTGPSPSVVEWSTRQCPSRFPARNITLYLDNMPQIQHLLLLRSSRTLELCFETLRDIPTLCPHLQTIEVVDFVGIIPELRLDTNSKEYLEKCVARRAEQVPGFTLQFVEDVVQLERLAQYYDDDEYFDSFERAMKAFETDLPSPFRG